MPGDGLLVWHVAPGRFTNEDETAKLVDLVCADGVYADAGYPQGRPGDGRIGGDNLDFWAHDAAYRHAHAGNEGDATDPFDGIRFTRLAIDTNPSSDIRGRLPTAAAGLELSLRRDGDAMVVDAVVPRWRGDIYERDVGWAKRVVVDGDLRVLPRGRLTIEAGTRVLVDDGDRLASGLDAEMVEIVVEGDLLLRGPNPVLGDIVFRALRPAGRWHGLVIRQAEGSQILAPGGGYRIEDARRDIYYAGAEDGGGGKAGLFQDILLDDGGSATTAGNRDGRLTAGETVSLQLRLGNWSMTQQRQLRLTAAWSDLLHAAEAPDGELQTRTFHLTAGAVHVVQLPPMTVAETAKQGDSLAIEVRLSRGSWQDEVFEEHTVRLPVVGRYPAHELTLTFAGREVIGGAVEVDADATTRVEAQVQGTIGSVEVVVSSRVTGETVAVLPMHRMSAGDVAGARFAMDWVPPDEGPYRLQPRVYDIKGHATFSGGGVDVWSLADPGAPRALVFLDGTYGTVDRKTLIASLRDRLDDFGLQAVFILHEGGRADDYADILARHATEAGLAVWLGRKIPRDLEPVLVEYMAAKGRLLVLSQVLLSTPSFREEVLRVASVRPQTVGDVAGIGAFADVAYYTTHEAFTVLPPAIPIAFDGNGGATGLSLTSPSQRFVLLSLDPANLAKEALYEVLGATLATLLAEAVDLSMTLDGVPEGQLATVAAQGETRIDILTDSAVDRVDLRVRGHGGGPVVPLPTQRLADPAPGRRAFVGLVTADDLEVHSGRIHVSAIPFDDAGHRLAAQATIEAVVLAAEADYLLLVDPAFGRAGLVTDALKGVGQKAVTVSVTGDDWPLQEVLLQRAADMEATIVWLAGVVPAAVPDALRPFVQEGGQVVLASPSWHSGRPDVREFFKELGVDTRLPRARSGVHGTPMGHEGVPFVVRHHPLVASPPAVVLMANESDRAVAAMARLGQGRLAVVSLDLAGIRDRSLLQHLMASIEGASHVELSVDHGEIVGGHRMVRADRPFTVRARLQRTAEHAEVVVRSLCDGSVRAVVPMVGADTAFTAHIKPPSMDRFALSVRVEDDGAIGVTDTSVAVFALVPAEDQPLLLLVTQEYRPWELDDIAADVNAALVEAGLRTAVVRVPAAEDAAATALLPYFAGPGQGVIWLAPSLSPAAQAGLRAFMDGGGRLLLASLTLPRAPGNQAFARTYLGIDAGEIEQVGVAWTQRGASGEWLWVRRIGAVNESDTHLVTDLAGHVVGVRGTRGEGEITYLGFDLAHLPASDRRAMLNEFVPGLRGTADGGAPQLRWADLPPSVVTTGPFTSRLVVVGGTLPSPSLVVDYTVSDGTGRPQRARVEVEPLAAGEERAVSLPPWTARHPGMVSIAVTMAGRSGTVHLEPRHIRVITARDPFQPADLGEPIGRGNGAGLFDADGDGDVDLYFTRLGAPNLLLRNDGAIFTEAAEAAGLDDEGQGRSLAVGDCDADGDLDVYLINDGPNSLRLNDGTGRFVAAGEGTAPLIDHGYGRAAAFLDADGDGDLDLYLVNARGRNRLLARRSDGWQERAAAVGLHDDGDGRGLALADYDHDGDTDLFVASLDGGRLYANVGDAFEDVTAKEGVSGVADNVSAVFGDADGDGLIDLFLASQTASNEMLRGTRDGFVPWEGIDTGQRSVGAAFVDFDNDADLDLVTTSLNEAAGGDQLYDNESGEWVPAGSLLGLRSHSQGRGLGYADVDGDGDQDLAIADAASSQLYWNRAGTSRGWLVVDLVGPPCNRLGIGARVEVLAGGIRQVREVQPTYGYGSQRPAGVHFGLGEAHSAVVVVQWPDGTRTRRDARGLNRVEINHPAVRTVVTDGRRSPASFSLAPGYPNPFNSTVVLRFGIVAFGPARLVVYNASGQLVRTLLAGELGPGAYRAAWDGRDEVGHRVASGVYLVRLASAGRTAHRRVVLVR